MRLVAVIDIDKRNTTGLSNSEWLKNSFMSSREGKCCGIIDLDISINMGVVVSSLPTAGGSKGNNTSVWTVVGKKFPLVKFVMGAVM
jgi:hypothetical protein